MGLCSRDERLLLQQWLLHGEVCPDHTMLLTWNTYLQRKPISGKPCQQELPVLVLQPSNFLISTSLLRPLLLRSTLKTTNRQVTQLCISYLVLFFSRALLVCFTDYTILFQFQNKLFLTSS